MKTQTYPRKSTTGTSAGTKKSPKNGETTQTQEGGVIAIGPDLQEHLQKLQEVSAVASKIFALLGEQITSASYTIPVQRGYETVTNLKARASVHRDELETVFDPLRDQLDQLKHSFWANHGKKLEAGVRSYVEKRIKDRVLAEVNKRLKRYVDYLGDKDADNRKLEEVTEISRARIQNSLVRSKYDREPIAWIGILPSGAGPVMTLEGLINAEGSSLVELAESLGISPAEEDDRIDTLNAIMRHLGIAYRGLPSRTGVLLMPTAINL